MPPLQIFKEYNQRSYLFYLFIYVLQIYSAKLQICNELIDYYYKEVVAAKSANGPYQGCSIHFLGCTKSMYKDINKVL